MPWKKIYLKKSFLKLLSLKHWRNISSKKKFFLNQKKNFFWLMWRIFSKPPFLAKERQMKWRATLNKLRFNYEQNSLTKGNVDVNAINSDWISSKRLKKYTKKKLRKNLKGELKESDLDNVFSPNDVLRAEMNLLKQKHKSKLSPFFFQPWKKVIFPLTRKQHWLKSTYSRYQTLHFKDRIDFFRTYLGQILKSSYVQTDAPRPRQEGIPHKYDDFIYMDLERHFPLKKKYFEFYKGHKMGWWYNNLVKKTKAPRSAKRFVLDRPRTAFQIHWTQQKLEPWKDALLFKRALYAGFHEDYRKETRYQTLKIKNYLRSKNPRQEKKNRLYTRANYLLNDFRRRYRIRANKIARIQQVAGKILRPFYGHLRLKQIRVIVKKSKKKKSKILNYNEVILSHFERRLDVVVYRINLAPSILWARRLIKAGFIFVISDENRFFWESMYRGLKKLSFPLKLRDPKNLYKKTYWKVIHENWVEFKFLGEPKKKISYLLQPGDLIQCAAGAALNHFKTRSWLCQKPFPRHLMVHKRVFYEWNWHLQIFKQGVFKNWEQDSESVSEAIFLGSPKFRDFDSKDRLNESFLRWAMI